MYIQLASGVFVQLVFKMNLEKTLPFGTTQQYCETNKPSSVQATTTHAREHTTSQIATEIGRSALASPIIAAVSLPAHARPPQIDIRELRQRRQARDITT
eukprot:COSAG06_NODE_12859_length_1319_cov_2.095902_1_plen_99_part_10